MAFSLQSPDEANRVTLRLGGTSTVCRTDGRTLSDSIPVPVSLARKPADVRAQTCP